MLYDKCETTNLFPLDQGSSSKEVSTVDNYIVRHLRTLNIKPTKPVLKCTIKRVDWKGSFVWLCQVVLASLAVQNLGASR